MIFDDKVQMKKDPRRQERKYTAQALYVPGTI